MQDEALSPLPEAALTVLELGGFRALREYVEAGMLAPGAYACPTCDGAGFVPGKKRQRKCNECKGAKKISVIVQTMIVYG